MKFDLVMGNPPYQNLGKDEANKLWVQFVKKIGNDLLKVNGIVMFITPTTWLNPSDDSKNFSILNNLFKKKQLERANVSTSLGQKYFPGVGQAFSIWKMTNTEYHQPTKFITDDGEILLYLPNYDTLPKNLNMTSISILEKFRGESWVWETQKFYVNCQKQQNDEYHFPVYHTSAQGNWYSKEEHPRSKDHKVMVSLSGRYIPVFSNKIGYTSMCITLFTQSQEEGIVAKSVLSSKLYRWCHIQSKHGGFNNIKTIIKFPSVDLTHTWTDQELYAHFNLTQEEIDYIETQVK